MPQQIGVSERIGRKLCAMVNCLLVDSYLPPNRWGELMLTAQYLCNRVLHLALQTETPCKVLYGKDADLSRLKIIGARAFVPTKKPTKLGHTSCEGMTCGFSKKKSNSYRVWNPGIRAISQPAGIKNGGTRRTRSITNPSRVLSCTLGRFLLRNSFCL